MKFKQVDLGHSKPYISLSDNYKCVKYGSAWFAFFKPKDGVMFGESCYINTFGRSIQYKSLKSAKIACEEHNERFNSLATFGDSILTA